MYRLITAVFFGVVTLSACKDSTTTAPSNSSITTVSAEPSAQDFVTHNETYNPEAVIPPQCYTKTEGANNPCYVCHQSYLGEKTRPNMMNDGFLQGSYDFSDIGNTNRWSNLFKNRSAEIGEISDEFMLDYINQDNYSALVDWFATDAWQGQAPAIDSLADGAKAFDNKGLALDGSRWVAFNYKPLPSTFWPTNGSTDDVMIRLPPAFSEIDGEFSEDVYFANLALLEMAMTELSSVSTIALNEVESQVDFNGNGSLETSVSEIKYQNHYFGDASDIVTTYMLYPEGTEFLHSVRYVGIDGEEIVNARRMKEVRYMRKHTFMPKERLKNSYYREAKEKHFGNLPAVSSHGDRGTSNGMGWLLWGFIEDAKGELRKQNEQEQFFCMGCHKTIGTTIDSTFAFARKQRGSEGWGYIDLKALRDAPNLGESKGEYLTYMERVGGGDEFRQNGEMLERWFDAQGKLDHTKVATAESIYDLVAPSKRRALDLNKAYFRIVQEQSYLFGRDAVLSPAKNVYREIDTAIEPLAGEFRYQWDIRLDWHATDTLNVTALQTNETKETTP
ncbi:hypothetical protein QWI17_17920 [Gilvimarinus sp. SDUM040013]|uniref:Lipoprotein n=1 Tax=Gilvimarinus gilvus TaxID=3058038 RepID=A0ABU4RVD5_9GAMM|nr:hypothetical protein [Gilvimarinus sp. SDUM040013]MDO3387726.1 hypothetical protein [Gilvimarinus sp. SDUM040013]MDX6848833.1 hypothetical protein [Gilvimarinus sp. SDUM040013]